MAGVKGRSGKPKDAPWSNALRMVMAEKDGDLRKLRRVADAVYKAALDGDMVAAKEIGDRLDGKATARVEHTGAEGGPIETRAVDAPPQETYEDWLARKRATDLAVVPTVGSAD